MPEIKLPCQSSGAIYACLNFSSQERISYFAWGLGSRSPGKAGQQAQGVCLSLLPRCWDCMHILPTLPFHMGPGDQAWVLMFLLWVLTHHPSLPPALLSFPCFVTFLWWCFFWPLFICFLELSDFSEPLRCWLLGIALEITTLFSCVLCLQL